MLAHLYPQADIPVVQLSINALKPLDYHVELGARLAPLRERGVMILCSGNVVHNLGRIDWKRPDEGFDWAHRFDDAVMEQLGDGPADILRVAEHRDYPLAVPTPDHFIPLLYLAGLAAEQDGARPLMQGYSFGKLSMTCYGVGVGSAACEQGEGSAGLAEGVPPEQTNI